MEIKSNKGGKRLGAGRKPVIERKQQVSLYIQPKYFYKFGSEENMKEKLYEFIENYDRFIMSEQPKLYDAPVINKIYFSDEPKKEIKLLRSFENYRQLKVECENEEDWMKLKEEIQDAPNLSSKQIGLLIN